MHLTVEIPDSIASRLTETGGGLERIEKDGFLKSHGIYEDYTLEDFEEGR